MAETTRKLGEFMVAHPLPDGWRVAVAKKGGSTLGYVSWLAKWRQFEFVPMAGSAFTWDCLRDLSAFLAELNTQRRGGAS